MPQRSHHQDASDYRAQAIEAAEVARAAAERAADAAGRAAHQAKDWAAPRVEKAYHDGARKAVPFVRKAGSRTEDWVDAARGAIVGAAIPAVIAAFERAAAEPPAPEPVATHRSNTWAKVLIPVLIAGAAGAALVIWARRDPGRDGWAGDDDEWDFSGDADFSQRLRRDVNRAVDATVDAAKKAASVVAVAAESVAEEAGPYVDKAAAAASAAATAAAARAKQEAARLREGVEEARVKATHELADAFDDAEDVWEDEGGPIEEPAPKKPRAPRKPKAE